MFEHLSSLLNIVEAWDAATAATVFAAATPVFAAGIVGTSSAITTLRLKAAIKKGGITSFEAEDFKRTVRLYLEPDCASIDPANEAEPRQIIVAREPVFSALDRFLKGDLGKRHLLILADSGMGKTSLLLNYYLRNLKKRLWNQETIFVIPLGDKDADRQIKGIKERNEACIFLDAFDEDTRAIRDHDKRLFELVRLTRDFKKVVITCRSQFFPSEQETPSSTGLARFGPRGIGDNGTHEFWKLYLMPLSDNQVSAYLDRCFPLYRRRDRARAQRLVDSIPSLAARPMCLAYLPDLMASDQEPKSAYELYEVLIQKWLEREQRWVPNTEQLREFSKRVAIAMYSNRETRGTECLSRDEVLELAHEHNVPISDWKITGRSLLNRDAEGRLKFAHRSIMEHFIAEHLVQTRMTNQKTIQFGPLTDQISTFVLDIVELERPNGRVPYPVASIIGHDMVPYYLAFRENIFKEDAWSHPCTVVISVPLTPALHVVFDLGELLKAAKGNVMSIGPWGSLKPVMNLSSGSRDAQSSSFTFITKYDEAIGAVFLPSALVRYLMQITAKARFKDIDIRYSINDPNSTDYWAPFPLTSSSMSSALDRIKRGEPLLGGDLAQP